MTLADHERQARRILTEAGVDSPGLCARVLTARAANLDKVEYILASREQLTDDQAEELRVYIGRRAGGEPLAYILGTREFYGLDFQVNGDTLIPRPETEQLVDLALAQLPPEPPLVFADIGCGTGCIGLSILHHRPSWTGFFLDNSRGALEVARRNGRRLALSGEFLLADMAQSPLAANAFDLVLANPPYIGRHERHLVVAETLAHEPHSALFSPRGGLGHSLDVIELAARSLRAGGLLLLEHGWGQHIPLAAALEGSGFRDTHHHKDLAGIYRCISTCKGDDDGGAQGL